MAPPRRPPVITPQILLRAYATGLFPMAEGADEMRDGAREMRQAAADMREGKHD